MTNLDEGVRFDLDRDGWPEKVSWTSPDSEDPWLAMDRNANGLIDHGGELFGNFTDQPLNDVDEPHGYRALGIYDSPAHGGNDDGIISAADSVFDRLLLWIDGNHNGRSEFGELRGLAESGVAWIGLWVTESRNRYPHGNEFRYMSLVGLEDRFVRSADVFLLTTP